MSRVARAPFGSRLASAVSRRGPLCVGIDPHPELLRAWGLSEDAGGLERFAMTCVEALAGEVAVLKPQSAFFERYGSRGVAVLERVVEESRQAGALVLADVKRGDIGSTMAAYAAAYLAEDSPLAVDAVTLSPYLGVAALEPAFELAGSTGRGVFVLARTSNPEATAVQRAAVGPPGAGARTLAQAVVDEVGRRNAGAGAVGDLGVVIGATLPDHELELGALGGPILAPGIGAQGATAGGLLRVFGESLRHVLPVSARAILRAGPDADALRAEAARVREAVGSAVSAAVTGP